MPLYEYECDACGERFEVIQKSFSTPAPEACAKCGKGPVHRMLSSPAIQFKGTGWYITDYAQKGKSDSGSGGSKGKSSDSGKSDSATDSKSDAATPKESSAKSDTPASAPSSTTPSSTKKD